MSVHSFPDGRVLRPAEPSPRREDRVETLLAAGLILSTAAQIGLWVWSWLA